MDIDILDSVEDLGYSGTLTDKEALKDAVKLGAKSVEFTALVSWLSNELQVSSDLEGCINAISDAEESSTFLLEVSSFLKELNCPYECLMDGPISQRLVDEKNRILLLDFLCTELQAARILLGRNQNQKKALDIELDSSTTATCLSSIGHVLSVDLGSHKDAEAILGVFSSKVEELTKGSLKALPEPVMSSSLTEQQWAALEDLQQDFHSEYKIRREMLLTRLDVTVQSFKWGENAQGKENEIAKTFISRRARLKAEPSVSLSDVLSAREDITILEKTSSANLVKNTKSSVNRVLIGNVPDRGGRPKEQRPPVEMPSWQKRTQGPNRGGHSRGRGKDFRSKGKGGGGGSDKRHKGAFDAAGKY